ncbi:UNVERIFIED_CONTAM: hypothetical protein PYX00_005751 [Menopon gallinae]|uniref:Probable deoxycytidylate deaminase n=1 Tax=Menopon gallinae TaxID=328185 RepID=A0AAW2HSU3_9NEOP
MPINPDEDNMERGENQKEDSASPQKKPRNSLSNDESNGAESSIEKSGGKRSDYISWEDYFMGLAVVASMRSKDPRTQVGACIVNQNNRVIGVGYNGFPNGCSDDKFPWTREKNTDNKNLYVVHAEMNAILNKNSESAMGCTIYVTLFPCNECAKCIIQSGIKKVVYLQEKAKKEVKLKDKAAKKMLKAAEVETEKFQPSKNWNTIGRKFN